MRRNARATATRTLRRAVTWKPKRAGTERLDVAELISPLRYDVLVRAEFFSFLESRPSGESPEGLVGAAWDEPYAVWFREVAMARFRPWVLEDPDLMASSFQERVLASAALLKSFSENGFDPRCPVTLRVTEGLRTSDTGVQVARTVHVGDGGHRLALLLHSGTELMPGMYRLDPRPMPLIDNTSILLRSLEVGQDEYLRFLAPRYTDRPCEDIASLREAVADDAALLAELDSVLAVHGAVTRSQP